MGQFKEQLLGVEAEDMLNGFAFYPTYIQILKQTFNQNQCKKRPCKMGLIKKQVIGDTVCTYECSYKIRSIAFRLMVKNCPNYKSLENNLDKVTTQFHPKSDGLII